MVDWNFLVVVCDSFEVLSNEFWCRVVGIEKNYVVFQESTSYYEVILKLREFRFYWSEIVVCWVIPFSEGEERREISIKWKIFAITENW